MRVSAIKNNSTGVNSTQKKQSFGNFLVVRIPLEKIPCGDSFSCNKVAKSAIETVKAMAEEIKNLTSNKLNLYRRTLDDMSVLDKYMRAGDPYEKYARTLYVDDNGGENSAELLDVSKYLLNKGLDFQTYAKDIFAPKKKGFLETPILFDVAYGAKPQDMIKL